MADTMLRDIDDELLSAYRAAAEANGETLNAALKAGLARGRPTAPKSKTELIELSRALVAASAMTSDSTQYIRWMRDTDDGRHLGGVRPTDIGQ